MLGKMRAWTAVAGLCLFGLALPAAAETLDFKFRTPPDAKDWKAVTQKWKVDGKGYIPILVTPGITPVTVLKDRSFKNLEFSAQLRDILFQSFAGVFIRGTVDGLFLSGYGVYVFNGGDANGLIELNRLDNADLSNGAARTILCDINVIYNPNSKITIIAKGSKLSVFYKNELVCSVNDGTYKTGSVGLIARDDNFDVIYRRAKIITPD